MMAKKRCESCGKFMRLTDLTPYEDMLDEDLLRSYGMVLSDADLDEFYDLNNVTGTRFRYVHDQVECSGCGDQYNHDEGKKYYWNPVSGNYDADAPEKPLTESDLIRIDNAHQEAAGQLALPI